MGRRSERIGGREGGGGREGEGGREEGERSIIKYRALFQNSSLISYKTVIIIIIINAPVVSRDIGVYTMYVYSYGHWYGVLLSPVHLIQ